MILQGLSGLCRQANRAECPATIRLIRWIRPSLTKQSFTPHLCGRQTAMGSGVFSLVRPGRVFTGAIGTKKGTPNDQSDDTILPIVNWRIQQVIMKPYSTIVTDDNKNGKKDVNRPEEILECIRALKGNDSYGRQIAKNPVLVKGPLVWYEDGKSPNGVSSFAHKGTGIPIKWHGLIYGPDHMVVPAKSAFKGKTGDAVCAQCHRSRNDGKPTEMIDRLILVDPIDVNGKPVYQTVREITGVNPK